MKSTGAKTGLWLLLGMFTLLGLDWGVSALPIRPPIHAVVKQGDVERAGLLFQGDPTLANLPDRDGFRPLDYAIARVDLRMIHLLLERGADILNVSGTGYYPVSYARQLCKRDCKERGVQNCRYLDLVDKLIKFAYTQRGLVEPPLTPQTESDQQKTSRRAIESLFGR